MTFKEKIVNLRKIKEMTQEEFAKAVGVSRQAVYKWESGQSYPEVPKLLEIKILFDISIDNLLDDSFDVVLPEKKKKKRTVKPEEMKEENKEPVLIKEEVPVEKKEEKEVISEPIKSNETVEETKEEQKKVGFFGRLFGRR